MKWIPVAEGVPDADTTVLIYSPDSDEPVYVGFFDGGDWFEIMGAPLHGSETVTHWMHFPDPPEGM